MSKVIDLPKSNSAVVELGPKRLGHSVFVEGRVIPNLHAHDHGGAEIEFVIDNRFSYSVPRDLSKLFAKAIAQSMAIGAGYSHLSAESRDRPFAPKAIKLGSE